MKKLKYISVFSALAGLCAFALSGSPAFAQTIEAIQECRTISAPTERLQCYDNAAAAMDNMSIANAPSSTQSNVAATTQNQTPAESNQQVASSTVDEDSFGADGMRKERTKEQKELRARLVGLQFTKRGKYVITLDNGQVWRQIDSDTNSIKLPRARDGGIPIIIKRRSLGSHMLRTTASKRSILVRRIK